MLLRASALAFFLAFCLGVALQAAAPEKSIPIVVFDAGHGGKDPGAVVNDLRESDLALEFTHLLREALLRGGGVTPSLTRTQNKDISLAERSAFVAGSQAVFLLSAHADISPDPSVSGVRIYYPHYQRSKDASRSLKTLKADLTRYEKSYQSRQIARQIASSVELKAGVPVKVVPADFYLLRQASVPGVLIELGFISSEADRLRLTEDAALSDLAGAVSSAIADMAESRWKTGAHR